MDEDMTITRLARIVKGHARSSRDFQESLGEDNCAKLLRMRRQLLLRTIAGDNLPQRAPAWYARRGYLVGGSGAGGLIPKETYKDMFKNFAKTVAGIKVVAQRLQENREAERCRQLSIAEGDAPAMGWWSVPTTWGMLLEAYAEELMARCVPGAPADVSLITCGSLRGAVPHTAYSPDGVGCVDWNFWKQFTVAAEASGKSYRPSRRKMRVALLEYKNPYSAAPPDSPQWIYEAQVRAGLDVLPLTVAGLLVQLVWRRAPVYSLGIPNEFNSGNGWKSHCHPAHTLCDDARRTETCCDDLSSTTTNAYGYTCILFRQVPGALLHPCTSRTPLQGEFSTEEFLSKTERKRMTKQCIAAIRASASDFPVKIPRELVGARGRLRHALKGDVCDVGASPHSFFAEVLCLWKQGILCADYLPLRLYEHGEDKLGPLASGDEYGILARENRPVSEDWPVVAVLPIKLYQIRAHIIDRDGPGTPFANDMAPRAALARAGADVLADGGSVEDAERLIWRGVEELRQTNKQTTIKP